MRKLLEIMKRVLKKTYEIIAKPFAWVYAHPVAGLGIGLAAFGISKYFENHARPFLAKTFRWIAATTIATAISGYGLEYLRETGKAASRDVRLFGSANSADRYGFLRVLLFPELQIAEYLGFIGVEEAGAVLVGGAVGSAAGG